MCIVDWGKVRLFNSNYTPCHRTIRYMYIELSDKREQCSVVVLWRAHCV